MTKIAFIGLGHMGLPMATRLLEAGFQVSVYDVTPEPITTLVAKGAHGATSVVDVVQGAELVMTMLQTGDQVQAVCLGEAGLFANIKSGALYVDSSSIDITITKALHETAREKGIAMLDAPVSGGVTGATAGTLTFMVGGSEDAMAKAQPFLQAMGKRIIRAGDAGAGQAAKICNNLILGISMIAVGEGFKLAEKLGLAADKFFEISSHASGQCWAMTSYCPVPGLVDNTPANHDYAAGFAAKMMLKDLRLAMQAGDTVDALIPLTGVAEELYGVMVQKGLGELDFSAVIKLLE